MQNLTKEWKQTPVVILQQANFCNILILCLWLRVIRRSDSQIFFNDISHGYKAALLKKNSLWLLSFYMDVASYCYYENARRTMNTAIVSYLLKYFYSFSVVELNNIERRSILFPRNFDTKRVIMEIAMMKILNNCVSDWLNNSYFPLNESSILY